MKLVRVGHIVINFDQVTYVKDAGTGALMIEFLGGKCMDLVSQADALRTWMAANLTDLTTTSGTGTGGSGTGGTSSS